MSFPFSWDLCWKFSLKMSRKKREQQQAREAVKHARQEGVDVDGGFGSRDWREDNRDV